DLSGGAVVSGEQALCLGLPGPDRESWHGKSSAAEPLLAHHGRYGRDSGSGRTRRGGRTTNLTARRKLYLYQRLSTHHTERHHAGPLRNAERGRRTLLDHHTSLFPGQPSSACAVDLE